MADERDDEDERMDDEEEDDEDEEGLVNGDGDDDEEEGEDTYMDVDTFLGIEVKGKAEYVFDDITKGTAILLTQACLGPDAKKGQHAVLTIQIGDDEKDHVVAHLSYDNLPTVSLDIEIDDDVVFSVVGDCAVHLSGRKIFEDEGDDEEEGEDDEGDFMRAYPAMLKASSEDDEDDDEEEDDEDEDEDEEDGEDQEDDEEGDEDDDEDDDDEDDEEDEKPVQKKQKLTDGAAKGKAPEQGKGKGKAKASPKEVEEVIAEALKKAPGKSMDLSALGNAVSKKFNSPFKQLGLEQNSVKAFVEKNSRFKVNGNNVKLN